MTELAPFLDAAVELLLEVLPFFALGALLAGILDAYQDRLRLRERLRDSVGAVVLGAAMGAVVPVCSCGAVPIALGLLAGGVAPGPVLAFLAAAPMVNPASFVMTAGVLGSPIAFGRLAGALGIGVAVGLVARRLGSAALRTPVEGSAPSGPFRVLVEGSAPSGPLGVLVEGPAPSGPFRKDGTEAVPPPDGFRKDGTEAVPPSDGFRKDGTEAVPPPDGFRKDGTEAVPPSGHCGFLEGPAPSGPSPEGRHGGRPSTGSIAGRPSTGSIAETPAAGSPCASPSGGPRWSLALLRAGGTFTGLFRFVLIGVALGALLEVFVDPDSMAGYFQGPLAVPFAAVAGIPLYVCSCAEVPVALSLLRKGLEEGAVLTFLLAGPGVSVFTLAMLAGALRARAIAVYVAVFLAGSVAVGYLWGGLVG